MRRAKSTTRVKAKGIAYTVLMEKAEGKSLLGRPRRRWEAIIIMYIKNGMGGYELG